MKVSDLKNLFIFSKRDRRGIIFLMMILLMVVFMHIYLVYFHETKEENYPLVFNLTQMEDSTRNKQDINKTLPELSYSPKLQLHSFDPNTILFKELIKMGLGSFQAGNIIKYREKGGTFRHKADVLKIYGIDDDLYRELYDFINIETGKPDFRKNSLNVTGKDTLSRKPDINKIGFRELVAQYYLNSEIAGRIIKYRDLLGGFYSCDQLYKVFEIDSNTVDVLCDHIKIDTSAIKKMNLNTVGYAELLKHPHFKKYEVKAIFSYRKNKKITSINELVENKIIDRSIAKIITHYIEFQ